MDMTRITGMTDLGILDKAKIANFSLTVFPNNDVADLQMLWQTRQQQGVGLYIGKKHSNREIYLSKIESHEAFEMLFFKRIPYDYCYTGKL